MEPQDVSVLWKYFIKVEKIYMQLLFPRTFNVHSFVPGVARILRNKYVFTDAYFVISFGLVTL